MRVSDTLADSRVQKPKISLHFSRASSPLREAEKEMERKFLVLLRRFSLRKDQSYFNIFVCSFLHPHGDRGASSPRSAVTLNFMPPTEFGGNSKIWFVLGTNKSVCACPARPCAHKSPAVLGDIIKRRGIDPLLLQL